MTPLVSPVLVCNGIFHVGQGHGPCRTMRTTYLNDDGFEQVALAVAEGVILAGADPHALRSAFENVIRNFVRFTPIDRRAGWFRICFVVGERSGSRAARGTARRHLRVILRAQQSGDCRQRLGLAIAAEAVRLHQGTVVAINRVGDGLEMFVELPLPALDREPEVPTVESRMAQAI
jgi:signal transduction histidine kinase